MQTCPLASQPTAFGHLQINLLSHIMVRVAICKHTEKYSVPSRELCGSLTASTVRHFVEEEIH